MPQVCHNLSNATRYISLQGRTTHYHTYQRMDDEQEHDAVAVKPRKQKCECGCRVVPGRHYRGGPRRAAHLPQGTRRHRDHQPIHGEAGDRSESKSLISRLEKREQVSYGDQL